MENPTKKCPQCQSDIPALAKICPNCKSDIRPKKAVKYLLISIGVIFGINMIAYAFSGSPAPAGSYVSNANPLEYGQIYGQMQIAPLLKSPSTAEFPRSYAKDAGNNLYVTSSYVDSQNSYGAMIRSYWETTMKYSGSNADDAGSWTVEKITFDGKVIYQAKK